MGRDGIEIVDQLNYLHYGYFYSILMFDFFLGLRFWLLYCKRGLRRSHLLGIIIWSIFIRTYMFMMLLLMGLISLLCLIMLIIMLLILGMMFYLYYWRLITLWMLRRNWRLFLLNLYTCFNLIYFRGNLLMSCSWMFSLPISILNLMGMYLILFNIIFKCGYSFFIIFILIIDLA